MANNVEQGHPVASLQRALEKGLDVSKVPTCAVWKEGEVKGCPHARECSRVMFGRADHNGFGPKNARPGMGGDGPQYVQFYERNAITGDEREDEMLCYAWMAGKFDDYRQQDRTGNVIEILGPPGTVITKVTMMPEDAVNSNRAGSKQMKRVETVVAGSIFSDGLDGESRLGGVLKLRENRRKLTRLSRLQAAGIVDAEDEAAGEPEMVVEPVAGVTAGPVVGGKGARRG